MTWTVREFSGRAWAATAGLRAEIDTLPLLTELAAGSLEPHRFVEYLHQDDHYLRGYARSLAMLASRAPDLKAAGFWAKGASEAVAAELEMHAAVLSDPRLAGSAAVSPASVTTRGYATMLQASAAYEPYAVGVAAVLPCYWVYADVGQRLAAAAATIADHPYRAWIAAYDDPAFLASTARAIELMDDAAEAADEATRASMLEIFTAATWYERQFWASSYLLEAWPAAASPGGVSR